MKTVPLDTIFWFQEGPGVRNYQYTQSGVKLLNVTNLVDGQLIISNTDKYISEEEAYGKYKHFLCDEGDLIIASSGITEESVTKKNGFVLKDDLPLCMNTSTIRFKPTAQVGSKYLYYFFRSNNFRRQIAKLMSGVAQLNFGPSHLHKVHVGIHEKDIENKIVAELDSISELIVQKKNEISLLDEQVKSLFNEMFSDSFQKATIGSVANVCRGASPRPITQYMTNDPSGENWIKIGDVEDNDIYVRKTAERVTKAGADKSRRIHPGDFILSNSMSFGRPYISAINGCVHDGWLILSGYEKVFEPLFLYYLLRSDDIQTQFNASANGATVRNLNSEKVKNVTVILPPLELQKRFVCKTRIINKLRFNYQRQIEVLQELLDKKMEEYFGGEES